MPVVTNQEEALDAAVQIRSLPKLEQITGHDHRQFHRWISEGRAMRLAAFFDVLDGCGMEMVVRPKIDPADFAEARA